MPTILTLFERSRLEPANAVNTRRSDRGRFAAVLEHAVAVDPVKIVGV
jgi:hypothetical protein